MSIKQYFTDVITSAEVGIAKHFVFIGCRILKKI